MLLYVASVSMLYLAISTSKVLDLVFQTCYGHKRYTVGKGVLDIVGRARSGVEIALAASARSPCGIGTKIWCTQNVFRKFSLGGHGLEYARAATTDILLQAITEGLSLEYTGAYTLKLPS